MTKNKKVMFGLCVAIVGGTLLLVIGVPSRNDNPDTERYGKYPYYYPKRN
jgi:hypothetical protein